MAAEPNQVPWHPFANAKGLLIVVPDDAINVEEEAAYFDQFVRRPTPQPAAVIHILLSANPPQFQILPRATTPFRSTQTEFPTYGSPITGPLSPMNSGIQPPAIKARLPGMSPLRAGLL
jgi:hypothetical protein